MHLVDEVHLVPAARRCVLHVVEQLPGIVDLRAGGRVHFDQVDEASRIDFTAGRALAARLGGHPFVAVEAFREDPGDRRLADAARPGEQERMMNPTAFERIDQRTPDMLLSDELREFLRAPLTRQCRVAHEWTCLTVWARRLRGHARSLPQAPPMEAARTSSGSGTRHRRCRCCLPALTGFTTGRRGEADTSHH